jgi:hypothetical protein
MVDICELALEFGVENEADWACRHFIERFLSVVDEGRLIENRIVGITRQT